MVSIDSVIYFQIIDPVRAAYEAQDYIKAIEQLTMTTLRNIIGGLDLEQTLTSREEINQKLRRRAGRGHRQVGDQGQPRRAARHRAARHDPRRDGEGRPGRARQAGRDPASPRASASRRSCPPAARRSPRSCGPRATGRPPCCGRRPTGRPRCCGPRARRRPSRTVFDAIHAGQPDQALLAYQYMQMLPTPGQGRRQQGLDRAERAERGAEGSGQRRRVDQPSAIPASRQGHLHRPAEDRRPGRDRPAERGAEEAASDADRPGGDRRRPGAGASPAASGRALGGTRGDRSGRQSGGAERLEPDRSSGAAQPERRDPHQQWSWLGPAGRCSGAGGSGGPDQHRRRVAAP